MLTGVETGHQHQILPTDESVFCFSCFSFSFFLAVSVLIAVHTLRRLASLCTSENKQELMEVLNILLTPIIEIIKCAGPPLKRQFGYCIHYKKNVEQLSKKVERLNHIKAEVQNKVHAAKRNLQSIKNEVEDWLERVDTEITQDVTVVTLLNGGEEVNNHQNCWRGWCYCRTRHYIGRKAQKKMVIVEELLNEGKSFGDNVSEPSLNFDAQIMPIANENFEDFTSRESTKNELMEALKDEGTHVIGLYGMPGAGKTMLMNQVSSQVMKEELFKLVIMITVTKEFTLQRIQGEIAKQLSLQKLDELDDIQKRAAMLRKRFEFEERFLMIIDDLWTKDFDLSNVGILCGENSHKCCKVVVATRSLDVCNSLPSQKIIEVKVLSEQESWRLFKKNAGDVVNSSPDLKAVAREVAKECGCLPIALVTLGRALRNKDKPVWDDTARKLKSNTYIKYSDKLFSLIKLSYDQLESEITKKYFLLCCLFPEDHRISMDDLMMYVLSDEEILEDTETLKQARDCLFTILDKIMASSLLLGEKKKHGDGYYIYVWMHDIIRDVAIAIASEDDKGFVVKVGMGLTNWPQKGRLLATGKCSRLSLMRNEICELPDQPQLPQLLSLSLEENKSLKEIPGNFFQGTKALAALNLSKTGICLLPASLSCLVQLHTLQLDYCDFDASIDISLIGELKRLEILSLQHCRLLRLPKEIGGLPNLKLLNLSHNPHLSTMPPNVLSNLSRLEELYMMNSFCQWEIGGMGTSSAGNATLDEVVFKLSGLNALHLDVHGENVKFFMSVDRMSSKRRMKYYGTTNFTGPFDCFLTVSPPFYHSLKVLLERVDNALMVCNCTGHKSIGQLAIDAGFKSMKSLFVEECHEVEYFMSTEDEITRTAFVALEDLHLCSLNKLKEVFHFDEDQCVDEEVHDDVTFPRLREMYLERLSKLEIIWRGGIPLDSLQHLTVMEVSECHGLRYLFTPSMIRGLRQLEKLQVGYCKNMVKIITSEEMGEEQELPHHNTTASSTIFTTSTAHTTTNTSPFPLLLPNLRELKIFNCVSLKHIICPSMRLVCGSLAQLQVLEVKDCESLVDIINENSVKEEDDIEESVVGHQLRVMLLRRLSDLVTSRKGIIPVKGSLENLENLQVYDCDRMKHLICGGGSQLKTVHVKRCNSLQEIINDIVDDEADGHDQTHIHYQRPILPQLVVMRLKCLPNLVTIARRRFVTLESFQNLQSLDVYGCDSMKHLLPMRLLVQGGLSKLISLSIEKCEKLEVVFNDDNDHQYDVGVGHHHVKISDVLPQLNELLFHDLPKFSSFLQGPAVLEWPSLEEAMSVSNRLRVLGRGDILMRLGYPHPTEDIDEHMLHKLHIEEKTQLAIGGIRTHAQVIHAAFLFRRVVVGELDFSYP